MAGPSFQDPATTNNESDAVFLAKHYFRINIKEDLLKTGSLKNIFFKNHLLMMTIGFVLVTITGGCAGGRPVDQSFAVPSGSTSRLVALNKGVCLDTKKGTMWQVARSRSITSLEGAKEYAASLKVGGYDDWRLPTVTELYDLYMMFDLHDNGDCSLQVEGTYWSDEPDLEGRVGTWELDDNCDPERQYIPKNKGKVRAIRSSRAN